MYFLGLGLILLAMKYLLIEPVAAGAAREARRAAKRLSSASQPAARRCQSACSSSRPKLLSAVASPSQTVGPSSRSTSTAVGALPVKATDAQVESA